MSNFTTFKDETIILFRYSDNSNITEANENLVPDPAQFCEINELALIENGEWRGTDQYEMNIGYKPEISLPENISLKYRHKQFGKGGGVKITTFVGESTIAPAPRGTTAEVCDATILYDHSNNPIVASNAKQGSLRVGTIKSIVMLPKVTGETHFKDTWGFSRDSSVEINSSLWVTRVKKNEREVTELIKVLDDIPNSGYKEFKAWGYTRMKIQLGHTDLGDYLRPKGLYYFSYPSDSKEHKELKSYFYNRNSTYKINLL